jgi:hypothetical protein
LVLNQAPGKTGKSPVFPLNSRKLFQKLKFWNSLNCNQFFALGILHDLCYRVQSFSQNSVSFGKSSGKSVLKAAFSSQSRVAFPKTEVLGKPLQDRVTWSFCPFGGR